MEDWKGSASDTSDLISRAPVSSILPVSNPQFEIRNPQFMVSYRLRYSQAAPRKIMPAKMLKLPPRQQ
jgi:hypothetical protein